MFWHSVHTQWVLLTLYVLYIISRSMVAVEERWDIIRFALETFPVISIYHLAKASISERPRLYLLFSYSDIGRWLIASSQPPSLSLSLCLSPKYCGHICIPTSLSQQCAGSLLIKMPGSSKGEEGVNRMALVMVLGPPSDKFSVFAHP